MTTDFYIRGWTEAPHLDGTYLVLDLGSIPILLSVKTNESGQLDVEEKLSKRHARGLQTFSDWARLRSYYGGPWIRVLNASGEPVVGLTVNQMAEAMDGVSTEKIRKMVIEIVTRAVVNKAITVEMLKLAAKMLRDGSNPEDVAVLLDHLAKVDGTPKE